MYISLCSAIIQGPEARWPELAHLAHRAGYRGVDVSLGRSISEGVDSTRALLKELAIKPACLDLPVDFRKDDATFQAGLKKLEPAAQFARAIGCPRMLTWLMPASQTPKPELRKIYKDRFQACAAVLERSRVRLGLEFVSPLHIRKSAPHEFIWRMDEMLEFAKECGGNVGLLLDAWHWHHAGATPRDILAAGKQRVVHVHLADAPGLPPEQIRDNERLIPGDGVIDWKGFLGALRKIGYEDGMSPEVLGKRLKELPAEEAARLALEKTRALLAKNGIAES